MSNEGTKDRPSPFLVCALVLGVGVVLLGGMFRFPDPQAPAWRSWIPAEGWRWWIPAVLALVLVLAVVGYARWRQRITSEDIWGLVTPLAVMTAVTVTATSIIEPWSDRLWVQFLLCVALVLIALLLTALEWSRSWFLGTGLLLIALMAALLVRVGFEAAQEKLVNGPITAATEEKEALDAAARVAADAQTYELKKASSAATKTLADGLPAASAEFRAAGQRVLVSLTPGQASDLPGALALLAASPVSQEKASQDLLVRTSAFAAAEAFQANATGASPPSSTAVQDAIDGAEAAQNADQEGSDLAAALHRLEVALAYFRSAVSPGDQSLKDAAAAAAAAEPEDLQVSLRDAVLSGPEVVIASIDSGRSLRLVPGPLGWLLLGVLALWVMRQLFRLNALQVPGPVKVEGGGDHNDVLSVAVLQNLKTPAASPGAAVIQSITDLSSLTGIDKGIVATVAAAISAVFTGDQGYVVNAEVAPAVKPREKKEEKEEKAAEGESAQPKTVLVTVRAASSEESLGVRPFTEDSPEKAVRAGGLWAAGFLLDRSTRIPKWASFTAQTADSLDAIVSPSPTLAQLEKAAKTAPTSGWILQLYGHKLELAGREREAIAVYARAVAAHPRYLVARYRLAAALGMLARDVSKWKNATYADQVAIGKAVGAACARLGLDANLSQSGQPPAVNEDQLRQLAAALLQSIEEDSHLPNHGAALLRRSDRDQSWLAWRGRHSSRRSALWLAQSARLVYLDDKKNGDKRKLEKLEGRVERQAKKPSSSWQLSYNLACYWANQEHGAAKALDCLETCLLHPGVEELDANWVRSDEDLKPLRAQPRFDRFCEQVEREAV